LKPPINQVIHNILNTHQHPSAPQDWDTCKKEIQSFCSSIGRPVSRCRRQGIKNLTNRIRKLQNLPSPPTSTITTLTNRLHSLESQLSHSIAIRSRSKWQEEGEQSNAYFYRRFHTLCQKSDIPQLYSQPSPSPNTNPSITTDPNQILNIASQHLTSLWNQSPPPTPTPLSAYIPHLNQTSINNLATHITPEEIQTVLSTKENHSSPGPDGLTYQFYKIFQTPILPILAKIYN